MRSGFSRIWYRHEFLSASVRGGIPVEVGKTYVLSCYLRAEKPDTYASLVLCNMAYNSPLGSKQGVARRFKLATEWQRYHVSCTYPEAGWTRGLRPELSLFVINQGVKCGIWADAVQLEEGTEPTEYVPREDGR